MDKTNSPNISFRYEIARKLIHLSSVSIPIVYIYLERTTILILMSVVTLLAVAFDLSRFYFPPIGKIFEKFFGILLRPHEKNQWNKALSGASYVFISDLLCIIIFPKIIAVTAMIVFVFGDSAAALIGRPFGKHKFLYKSLEGTLAFVFVAWVIVLLTPKVSDLPAEYAIGFAASIFGALSENIARAGVDDNLLISMTTGFVMWVLYLVFLPQTASLLTW